MAEKQMRYTKGNDAALDQEFQSAVPYSKVKLGKTTLFWRFGLRWYQISLNQVQRIFRRVEQVVGRLCCGGQNFVIERLVLILKDGSEVVIHIGDDVQPAAEALLQALKDTHPELEYGVQK